MTTEQYERELTNAVAEEYDKIMAGTNPLRFDRETVGELIAAGAAEHFRDRLHDEEFVKAAIEFEIRQYFKELAPKGYYDPQAWIPVSKDNFKGMGLATRDDLIYWHSTDFDRVNEPYIVDRVNNWPPDCKTLAEVENLLTEIKK